MIFIAQISHSIVSFFSIDFDTNVLLRSSAVSGSDQKVFECNDESSQDMLFVILLLDLFNHRTEARQHIKCIQYMGRQYEVYGMKATLGR